MHHGQVMLASVLAVKQNDPVTLNMYRATHEKEKKPKKPQKTKRK